MARDHQVPTHDHELRDLDEEELPATPGLAPGKRTLTSRIPVIFRVALPGELAPEAPARLERALGSSGQPLPDDLRARLERGLRVDLSGVRVHTGTDSAAAAQAVQAKAFTVGQDIHFGPGRFDPVSTEGQRLLAHEVAHTVQQGRAGASDPSTLEVSEPGDAHETDADRFAGAFMAGDHMGAVAAAPSRGLARAVLQRELDEEQKKKWDEMKGDDLVNQLKGQTAAWKTFRQAPATHDGMPGKEMGALIDQLKELFDAEGAFRTHFTQKVSAERMYLREMASMNRAECGRLEEVGLATGIDPAHKWVMTAGAAGDPLGKLLKVSKLTVTYSNALGWNWVRGLDGNLFSFSVSAGKEAGSKAKGGSNVGPATMSINGTAEATSVAYWGYENLPGGIAVVSGPSGSVQVGGGVGASFNSGGLINLIGTGAKNSPLQFKDFEGKAELDQPKSPKDLLKKPAFSITIVSMSGGLVRSDGQGVDVGTAEPVPVLVEQSKTFSTIIRGFESGEDQIPAGELKTMIVRLKNQVEQHRALIEANRDILRDEFNINEEYRLDVQVSGYASRIWAAVKDDAERMRLNQELSTRRAQQVTAACYETFGSAHSYAFSGKGAAVDVGEGRIYPEAGNEEQLQKIVDAEVEIQKRQFPDIPEAEIRKSVEQSLGKRSNQSQARIVHVQMLWVGHTVHWGPPNQTPMPHHIPDPGGRPEGGGGGEEGAGPKGRGDDGSGGAPRG